MDWNTVRGHLLLAALVIGAAFAFPIEAKAQTIEYLGNNRVRECWINNFGNKQCSRTSQLTCEQAEYYGLPTTPGCAEYFSQSYGQGNGNSRSDPFLRDFGHELGELLLKELKRKLRN